MAFPVKQDPHKPSSHTGVCLYTFSTTPPQKNHTEGTTISCQSWDIPCNKQEISERQHSSLQNQKRVLLQILHPYQNHFAKILISIHFQAAICLSLPKYLSLHRIVVLCPGVSPASSKGKPVWFRNCARSCVILISAAIFSHWRTRSFEKAQALGEVRRPAIVKFSIWARGQVLAVTLNLYLSWKKHVCFCFLVRCYLF